MEPRQQFFSALWDYAVRIRDGYLSVEQAQRMSLKERNAKAKELRRQGYRVKCFTMPNQLRQYWGFGDPCGLSCTVYGINITEL